MSDFRLGQKGLEMNAPQAGDIVTVHVRPRTRSADRDRSLSIGILTRSDQDEAELAQHYAMTAIWTVIAANGGQAVIEQVHPPVKPGSWGWDFRRRVFPIHRYRWFEASALLDAVTIAKESGNE